MIQIAGADDMASLAGLDELILEEAVDFAKVMLSDDSLGDSCPRSFCGSHLVGWMRFCILCEPLRKGAGEMGSLTTLSISMRSSSLNIASN